MLLIVMYVCCWCVFCGGGLTGGAFEGALVQRVVGGIACASESGVIEVLVRLDCLTGSAALYEGGWDTPNLDPGAPKRVLTPLRPIPFVDGFGPQESSARRLVGRPRSLVEIGGSIATLNGFERLPRC